MIAIVSVDDDQKKGSNIKSLLRLASRVYLEPRQISMMEHFLQKP